MFGIGFGELVVIAVLAVLVFGPDRLPELAQQAGRFVRQLRKFATSARDELRSELGPEFADLELSDLDPRAIVRKHIAEAMAELDDLEDAIRSDEDTPKQVPLGAGERPPYDVDAT
ncbi:MULTISPECIES: sec-independent translocase [unclassified Nocardioides]|uniref:sec-independent translocase n=1 Tax=unclassified Nocardioides TaxID=2615069 RepID=UPI0006F3D649|nr:MULTISPECIES: sec-independent translocase [unclassified Nocardioides]KRA38075.1 translocase [Nocardioides sp. Root614]KRA92035.1 translocase [Nocardioides sp. Root682]